jgi:hypothetical protein
LQIQGPKPVAPLPRPTFDFVVFDSAVIGVFVGIALTMKALTFVIEFAVVRHHAFAAIFITPLTILPGEAATLGNGSPSASIQARFFDPVFGCFVGLIGGVCLHSPRFRDVVGRQMRRLMPSRLVR